MNRQYLLGDVLEYIVEGGMILIFLIGAGIMVIALLIRMVNFVRTVANKETSLGFRSTKSFYNRLAMGLDCAWFLLFSTLILERGGYYYNEGYLLWLIIIIGLRIALYFAIRTEDKKKK